VDGPPSVQLVVAVHAVPAAEPNQHGFGSTGHAQHLMAENEVFGV